MQTLTKFLNMGSRIIDIFFPEECAGCRAPRTILCEECLAKVPRAREHEYNFVHPVFDYRHPYIKRAMWRFKYKNSRGVAEIFGEFLYNKILDEFSDELDTSRGQKLLLVPIPLHKSRLRERGYNQSEA
ncbi:MAG: hypothetical protein PHS95_01970, partial [Candidatus Pacebacteria bacterium]|nr:hypothetical protein [Candidatus Paceibacterota bacterium]